MSEAGPETTAAPPSTAGPDRGKLDRSLAHGIAWTGIIQWASQFLSWAGTLVVARFLTPGEFGLVATANVFIGLVDMVCEMGLGVSIIRRRVTDRELIGQINTLSMGLGVGFALVTLLVRDLVASLLGNPQVGPIIGWLALTFVISSSRVVPRAMLSLDLRFKKAASLDAIEAIVSSIIIVVLAIAGFSSWSIVIGVLIGKVASAIAALSWTRPPFRQPRFTEQLRDHVGYGLNFLGSRLAWYGYNQADFAVVARLLGTTAVGYYSFGRDLAWIPIRRVSGLVSQVATPVFARVQENQSELARYLLGLTESLAFLTLPFSAGLALVAPELVEVALGPQWRPAIVPLQLLGFYAAIRTITSLVTNVLQAIGKAKEVFHYTVMAAIVLTLGFIVGAQVGGLAGVAVAWVVFYPVIMYPQARLAFQLMGIGWRDFVAALLPASIATALMTAVVLGVAWLIDGRWPSALALAMKTLAGIGSYAGWLYLLYRDRVTRLLETVRAERAQSAKPAKGDQ